MLLQPLKSEIVSHISYIIGSKNESAVIDPRRDCQVYLEIAAKWGARIKYVFETHRNEDYVTGSQELANLTKATVFHGPGLPWKYGKISEDNQEFSVGLLRIKALHTPGHSPESMSYVVYDSESGDQAVIVFTGDTLFVGDVGRTDFLGAELTAVMAEKMYESIMERLMPLGEGVIVCPAHGAGSVCGGKIRQREISTLGVEKRTNPMLKLGKKEFVAHKSVEKHQTPPYFKQMENYNLNGPPVLGTIPNPLALTPMEFAKFSEKAYVIDTRSPAAFGGAHIKGSYSLPPSRLSNAGWVVDYEKNILLVVENLEALDFAVRNLFRLGYDKIEGYLTGGLEEWYKQGFPISKVGLVSVQELRRMTEEKEEVAIVDVRRQSEWNEGYIEGSKHIYLGQLEKKTDQLPRNVPIVVVCKTGNRSSFGASMLLRAGFECVYNCLGGTDAWIKSGFPLTK
jgi:hydroxyacylglutathione hydrolase